ncbi:PspC domain-containing protein [Actinomycetaceae bacterium TAE3-ERU4]|nr:PspC domain-containing protein [Actinomycetaceae bacterium TAE3-ERU4]
MNKKFYRSNTNYWAGGVCGGISEYFNLSYSMVRLLVFILLIFHPILWAVYIFSCFLFERNPYTVNPSAQSDTTSHPQESTNHPNWQPPATHNTKTYIQRPPSWD